MESIETLIEQLTAKKPSDGYAALKQLLPISEESNDVYPYMGQFIKMLDSDNSFVRTRALALIVANAKWDSDYLIDENIDAILAHIVDPKPITARQFIGILPKLWAAKPDLWEDILSALRRADTLRYPLSMRSLVDEDIRKATLAINREEDA